MENKKSKLDKLKEEYNELQKKYNLPKFNELNEEFSIESLAKVETDYLIKYIGKQIIEKFSMYSRFLEYLLNPANATLFTFSFLKSLNESEKKKLGEIYNKISAIELKTLELELDFSDKKEAEFVIESYKIWKEIKKELLEITKSVQKNWDKEKEKAKDNRGYFN